MKNAVEMMDRLRTRFITAFTALYVLLMGFWILWGVAFSLLRPQPFGDFANPSMKRWVHFITSTRPILEIVSVATFTFFAIALVLWLLYKKKLSRNPAIDTAVRDERVRLIWLLSFRRTMAVAIALQFVLWILNNSTLILFGRDPLLTQSHNLMLLVLVVVSLGTFLSLDRRRTELSPSLTSFESAVIRKAPSLLGLYLGWHLVYMIGTIYRNCQFLLNNKDADYPRVLRILKWVRGGWLAWIAILAIMVYFFLFRSSRSQPAIAVLSGDERIWMNWLKACRVSFLIVLTLFLAPLLPWIPFFIISIFSSHLAQSLLSLLSLSKIQFIFANVQFNLLAAVIALLGSYLYYDRKD
ncbi:MAG: hypothetical protein NTZ26_12745 [Candidatus Aminicenantes bacterium]|nr:hypothetical protein [Candidatus Aminicenantes bacterium]